MRVRIVIDQFKVLILEIEYVLYIRIYFHLRKCPRLTAQLEFHLFQVVQIDMCISQGMYKIPAFNPVTWATICKSNAYDAMLKGTPRKISALRW